MDIIKQVSYNKTTDKGLYLVDLKYGLRDDKSNHQLILSIYEITDKKLGQKSIVVKDEITDVIGAGIYEKTDLPDDLEQDIINIINDFISSVENKEKNINNIKEKLENIKNKEEDE